MNNFFPVSVISFSDFGSSSVLRITPSLMFVWVFRGLFNLHMSVLELMRSAIGESFCREVG